MRFEEWKKTQDDQYLCARHVWEAAQKIEREACAMVCDEIAEHYGQDGGSVADHCAITIRAR